MTRVDDVFTPGGMPEQTYVNRDHLSMEAELKGWISRRQKPLLSVSGPTKSGKTVLLKRLLPNAVWLSGGAIDSSDDFWYAVSDELEVFTDHSVSGTFGGGTEGTVNAEVDLSVAKFGAQANLGSSMQRSIERSRSAPPRAAARKELHTLLRENSAPILIIDDFHYISSEQQLQIVRGLKDLIFEGLGVVVAAVPHRAYDVVRVEKEMTARVETLAVEPWGQDDLALIAIQGFKALNVEVSSEIMMRIVAESFGSPHLMQTHCLNLCFENELSYRLSTREELHSPDWPPFFEQQASATSKSAFDLLKNGPRTRTDRKARILKSEVTTDIYGAVLAAIEQTGPRTMLSYDEIRSALREVMMSELPQRHEVTNVLEQMTSIAKTKWKGSQYSNMTPSIQLFTWLIPFLPITCDGHLVL